MPTALSQKRDCGCDNGTPAADALCRPECGGVRARTVAAAALAASPLENTAVAARFVSAGGGRFYNSSTAPPPLLDQERRRPNASRPDSAAATDVTPRWRICGPYFL